MMKRTLSGVLGALVLSGAVLGSLSLSKPAQADLFHKVRARHEASSRRRTSVYRYYRDGRYWSTPRRGPNGDLDRDGIRNKNDRDRDGDGRRNKKDDHPSDRRRK
jgi:hypothetical protein